MFKQSVKVKQVGGDLVASFDSAEPMLVWKFDLQRYHSFTVALKGEEGDWVLGVTSPREQFYPVAHFPIRRDGEMALKKVHKVLAKKKSSTFMSFIKYFSVLAMLVFVMYFAVEYFFKHDVAYMDALMPASEPDSPPIEQPVAPTVAPTVAVTHVAPPVEPLPAPSAVEPPPTPQPVPIPAPPTLSEIPNSAAVPANELKPPTP
jgi:hypothetical protein